MSNPKDITEALSKWQGSAPTPAQPQSPTPSAPLPAARRLRADIPGGIIYTIVIGALLSQVIFMAALDIF